MVVTESDLRSSLQTARNLGLFWLAIMMALTLGDFSGARERMILCCKNTNVGR